jgi:hypothetical protein
VGSDAESDVSGDVTDLFMTYNQSFYWTVTPGQGAWQGSTFAGKVGTSCVVVQIVTSPQVAQDQVVVFPPWLSP